MRASTSSLAAAGGRRRLGCGARRGACLFGEIPALRTLGSGSSGGSWLVQRGGARPRLDGLERHLLGLLVRVAVAPRRVVRPCTGCSTAGSWAIGTWAQQVCYGRALADSDLVGCELFLFVGCSGKKNYPHANLGVLLQHLWPNSLGIDLRVVTN